MGLDRRKHPARASSVTGAATRRFSQEMPEKLPMDQLWRLTMLESSAKATRKSVMAEQMYPIITPATTSRDICRTRREISSTKAMDSMAPTKAAAIMPQELMTRPRLKRPIITRDTATFDPEEIPRTKGPAMGLAKKVWSRKPDTARDPPSSTAAATRGRRISHTTGAFSPPPPRRMAST